MLDLDDPRTRIGHDHRGERSGQDPGQIDHVEPGQRRGLGAGAVGGRLDGLGGLGGLGGVRCTAVMDDQGGAHRLDRRHSGAIAQVTTVRQGLPTPLLGLGCPWFRRGVQRSAPPLWS